MIKWHQYYLILTFTSLSSIIYHIFLDSTYHLLWCFIIHFSICACSLYPLDYKWNPWSSLLTALSQCLRQCLTHYMWPVNISWVNDRRATLQGMWKRVCCLHFAAEEGESLRGFVISPKPHSWIFPGPWGEPWWFEQTWCEQRFCMRKTLWVIIRDSEFCRDLEWSWQGKEKQFSGRKLIWKSEARTGCKESWVLGW